MSLVILLTVRHTILKILVQRIFLLDEPITLFSSLIGLILLYWYCKRDTKFTRNLINLKHIYLTGQIQSDNCTYGLRLRLLREPFYPKTWKRKELFTRKIKFKKSAMWQRAQQINYSTWPVMSAMFESAADLSKNKIYAILCFMYAEI